MGTGGHPVASSPAEQSRRHRPHAAARWISVIFEIHLKFDRSTSLQ